MLAVAGQRYLALIAICPAALEPSSASQVDDEEASVGDSSSSNYTGRRSHLPVNKDESNLEFT